ncbi:MAG TPA: hypothetical protein VNZ47_04485 [Candidatus Dormibacteraeota bacterium]|nr:hypothetical protein [Candidatus Dormibacteraeota bacterium]
MAAQICVALILGLVFLGPHFLTTGLQIFNDLSWMVGLMITAAMLGLFCATSTLIELVAEADTRIPAPSKDSYVEPVRFWLSDGKFISAGTAFGALNCLMGYSFGIQYHTLPSELTIFLGFFIVGFVAGMAAYGLPGVLGLTRGITKANPPLDYRDLDRCGGTSFLGQALIKFSSLNLVMGVMISIYIVFAPWTHRNQAPVRILLWAWIAFPFIVSSAHLIGPGGTIHGLLRRYKKDMQNRLATELKNIKRVIETSGEQSKELREDLEYNLTLQRELYKMRTWPFSSSSIVHYGVAFCLDTVPACWEIVKLFTEKHPPGSIGV